MIPRAAAAVLLASLAGCHARYDEDRLVAVCRDGAGYDAAAAYDPNPSLAVYPLGIVRHSATGTWFAERSTGFGSRIAAAGPDTIDRTALVLCVDQEKPASAGSSDAGLDCQMDALQTSMTVGPHGATDVHVDSTGAKVGLRAFGSQVHLSMREARTGRVLGAKTIDIPAMCPLVTLGDEHVYYQDISDADLAAFARTQLPRSVAASITTQ